MNIFSVRLVALLNDISVWWHVFGVLIIVGFLVFKPDHHQSVGTVFSKTINNSGFSHQWLWFVLLLGLLQAQYTFTGYDASAHMSEETQDAGRSAARGVVMSVVVSAIFGYILALGVTFAIQSFDSTTVGTVFSKTINNSGFSHGWLWFVLLLGLLQAQYTFTGYDASAHMSEETQDASRSAARGVVMSIVVSAVFGYILALGVTFAIQSFDSTTGAGIFAVKQVFLDSLGLRAAEFVLFIIVGRAALLRHVVDHVGVADAVRVLA